MDEVAEAKRYDYNGQMLTVKELVKYATNGITAQALRYRLSHGVEIHTAMTEPVKLHSKKKELPCGARNALDCLNCRFEEMPCLTCFAPLKGESMTDYIFDDYGKR